MRFFLEFIKSAPAVSTDQPSEKSFINVWVILSTSSYNVKIQPPFFTVTSIGSHPIICIAYNK